MVFEAHCMSFPCTELLLLFNYAEVNTVFHSMAPLSMISSVLNYCNCMKANEIVKIILHINK